MSTREEVEQARQAMAGLAAQLQAAAHHYRCAWNAQRVALDSWNVALEAVGRAYGEGSPPAVAMALQAFNSASAGALLLTMDLDDEAMVGMEAGAKALERVAQAGARVAEALLTEAARGGPQ